MSVIRNVLLELFRAWSLQWNKTDIEVHGSGLQDGSPALLIFPSERNHLNARGSV